MKRTALKRGSGPRRRIRLAKESKRRPTVKQLDALCREIVMLRDNNQCQLVKAGMGPCGGHLQACHILGKGAHPGLRHEPLNVIAGCWRHHAPQSPVSWHSNPMEYGLWFKDAYPERWAKLKAWSQTTQKRDAAATRLYLEEILRRSA